MRLLHATLFLSMLLGCSGSKEMENAWTEEPVQEHKRFREVQELGVPKAEEAAPTSAWVGVRHDVALSANAGRAEKCSCLAAVVAGASDPKFEWQGERPKIGADAEVIALTARGVACPNGPAENARRASISAVDRENDDVIVEVEEIPEGRPLATGAIIPRPGPNGAVYVRPKSKYVPYARGNGRDGRCRVD